MGITLPALNIRPPAPTEDPLSQFGRVVALRNMLQVAPLEQQRLQLENQQTQYNLASTGNQPSDQLGSSFHLCPELSGNSLRCRSHSARESSVRLPLFDIGPIMC
jgi:hypothetical protein